MHLQLPARLGDGPIHLRRWEAVDAPAMHDLVLGSLDHLRPWMPWIAHEPATLEARTALIEQWADEAAAGGDAVYAVVVDGAVAGSCGLHQRIGPRGLEIGYWLGAPFTGRGAATLAARLLTDAAFDLAGVDVVEIHHDKANLASAAIPRRLGFDLVEEHPVEVKAPGECGIGCVWRIDRASWRPAPAE